MKPITTGLLDSARSAALASAALAALLYSESYQFDYVYDDVAIAVQDPRLDEPNYFLRLWTEPWWGDTDSIGESRPLTTLTFWVDRRWGESAAAVAHVENLVLMCALAAIAALAAASWIGRPWVAWPVGLVVAAHPIHVEATISIVGRAELLAAVFTLVAILLWSRTRLKLGVGNSVAIGLCILAAGLSKETGYLAAPVILLAELAERRREGTSPFALGRLGPLIACITCVAVIAVAQRSAVHAKITEVYKRRADHIDPMMNPLVMAPTAARLLTPIALTGKAGQLLLLPTNQSPDYGPQSLLPVTNPSSPLVLFGMAVIFSWLTAARYAWNARSPALGPVLACLVAWAIPSNSLFLIGVLFAERVLLMLSIYVPIALSAIAVDASQSTSPARLRRVCVASIVAAALYLGALLFYSSLVIGVLNRGLVTITSCAILAIFIAACSWAYRRRSEGWIIAAVASWLCAYSLATHFYTPHWQSWPTLVLTTATRHPENGKFQGELSYLLLEQAVRLDQPLYDEAGAAAERAISIWELQTKPYVTLACLAQMRGDEGEATRLISHVRTYDPDLRRFAYLLDHFGVAYQ